MKPERTNFYDKTRIRQEAFCLLFEKTFTDMDLDEIIQGATETRDLQVNDFTLKLAKEPSSISMRSTS